MTFEQNYTVSCGRGWTMLGAVSVFECGADGAITPLPVSFLSAWDSHAMPYLRLGL